MRAGTGITSAALAIAALSGCGGGGDGGGGSKSAAAPEPSLVLTHDTPVDFAYGDSATLHGQVASGRVGTVQLEASPYPFSRYRRIASARPGSDGLFKFKVRPRRNTRYRAVADKVSSRPDTLVVSLRGHFFSARVSPREIQVFLVGTGPRGIEPRNGTKVFFYIRRRGSHMYRLMGARVPEKLTPKAVRAGGNFNVPPRAGDRFLICPGDGGMAIGLGFKKSPVPGCGHRSIAG
jgi:hypothetical protein